MDKWSGRQNGGNHCHKKNTEKRMKKKNEDSLRDFWNIIKCTNIHIIVIAEGEERERENPKKYLKR